MLTERLQHMIDVVQHLPPEKQDRVATAIQLMLQQPLVTSDAVRPEVMEAFIQVMEHSTEVLDYLMYRAGDQQVAQALNADVSSFGDTPEEARAAIQEALELYFEGEAGS